ncbi:MAG: hypothetical protein ILP23_01365 [Paludibacteraceae bacterium]|nr:hypothetical protein [Paludibacteraceae bacterium]
MSFALSSHTFASNLPTKTLVVEKDTVIYANESFTIIANGNTDSWYSVPTKRIVTKAYTTEDMGVELGTKDCISLSAGGASPNIKPTSGGNIAHMNVSNVRTVRVYGIVDSNLRGIRIHANNIDSITDTYNLTNSELKAEYQVANNTGNQTVDFALDLKDLVPTKKYILTFRGFQSSTNYSHLYAVKLYAANTPTLRIEEGPKDEDGNIKTVVTARSEMEPIVVRWTNPKDNNAVPCISWTNGNQPEWLNIDTDETSKTITISGTPTNNDFVTPEALAYEITIAGGESVNGTLKVNKHYDNPPAFGIESNHSYLPGENANFTVTYNNVKALNVTGLPSGFEYTDDGEGTITITGQMDEQSEYPKTFNFQITPTPLDDYEGEVVPYNGTITAIDPNAPKVAFVYTNDKLDALDVTGKIYNVINTNYKVTAISSDNISEYDNVTLAPYDLIVLHESANSSSTGAINVGTWIGNKPVLNTKAHVYGKDNWPMMGANVTDDGESFVSVSDVYRTHTIFNGIDNEYGVTIGGNVRGVYLPGKKQQVIYQMATNSAGNTAIIEENNGKTGSNKYMMIAIGADNPEKAIAEDLTADGRRLIKNACDYLLDNTNLWTTTERSHEAEIKSFVLNGATGVFDGENIYVRLLSDTTETSDLVSVVPTIVISDNATITNDGVPMDFSNGNEVQYTVTSEDNNNSTTYNVIVELVDMAIETPFLDSIGIGTAYVKPDAIYSTNGTLTYMPAYAKEDASLWTQSGEAEGTASVLRISANSSVTIMVKDPSTVTVGMSSTGGREFKAYIDGTMISTTKVKSLVKAEINIDVNLNGIHFITIDNIGTGNSVIGFIKITSMNNTTTSITTPNVESNNVKEIIDTEYYSFDGKKLRNATMIETPVIRVTKYNTGEISVDKIHMKR